MGDCERRVCLDHRHGRRLSAAQAQAVKRGLRLHAAFDAQADAERGPRGRCFIATHIFGAEAQQTVALRHYRDSVLKASSLGRRLIVGYYRAAPCVCAWLTRHPWGCVPIRFGLQLFVGYARWRCSWKEASHEG